MNVKLRKGGYPLFPSDLSDITTDSTNSNLGLNYLTLKSVQQTSIFFENGKTRKLRKLFEICPKRIFALATGVTGYSRWESSQLLLCKNHVILLSHVQTHLPPVTWLKDQNILQLCNILEPLFLSDQSLTEVFELSSRVAALSTTPLPFLGQSNVTSQVS
ncbi:hypothetical protein J6590_051960 [Homalodisca vitripennis]|nr:hypothetical protein J6590_051960 [Homalodisca vitripennis]